MRYLAMAKEHAPLIVNKALSKGLAELAGGTLPPDEARGTLGKLLQSALRLEFATVPPYLAAAYSLGNSNERIRHLILRIAREEMLHMTAVANIMNAIGVAPDIVGAVSAYPCDLDLLEPSLLLDLKSFSFSVVDELLMRIEVPEDPVKYPKKQPTTVLEALTRPRTIGQFYASIIEIIESGVIDGLFDNSQRDLYKQIQVDLRFHSFAYLDNADDQTYPLKSDITFLIDDKASAVRHLKWIVEQGEGADPLDPLTAEGIPGHYYRLASILNARYLIPDPSVKDLKHSFSGADLVFDQQGVHEFDVNPKHADYVASAPTVATQMKLLNDKYTAMINDLQTAFNCPTPQDSENAAAAYGRAIGVMRRMTTNAGAIVRAARNAGIKAGLPFEYLGPGAP